MRYAPALCLLARLQIILILRFVLQIYATVDLFSFELVHSKFSSNKPLQCHKFGLKLGTLSHLQKHGE